MMDMMSVKKLNKLFRNIAIGNESAKVLNVLGGKVVVIEESEFFDLKGKTEAADIEDLRIYDELLSEEEIKTLYKAHKIKKKGEKLE